MKNILSYPPTSYPVDENEWVIFEDDIDQVAKEMVGKSDEH